MRVSLLVFFVTLSQLAFGAGGNRIDCHDVVNGDGVKVVTDVSFTALGPKLEHLMKLEIGGQPPLATEATLLSSGSVCGLNLDFAKSCKATEKFDPKFGYSFSFQCGADITSAEVYCDEGCLTSAGSGATFRCVGPKVEKKLWGAGMMFQGCKFTKAN